MLSPGPRWTSLISILFFSFSELFNRDCYTASLSISSSFINKMSSSCPGWDTYIDILSFVFFSSLGLAVGGGPGWGFIMRTFSLGISSSIGMKPDLRNKREILFSSYLWGVPLWPQFISTRWPSGLATLSWLAKASPLSFYWRSNWMLIRFSNTPLLYTKKFTIYPPTVAYLCMMESLQSVLSSAKIANSYSLTIVLKSLITLSLWVNSSCL